MEIMDCIKDKNIKMNQYGNNVKLNIEKSFLFNDKVFKEGDVIEVDFLYEFSKSSEIYKETRKTIKGKIIKLEDRYLELDISKEMESSIQNYRI